MGLDAAQPFRCRLISAIGLAVMVAVLASQPARACVGDCTGAGTVGITDLILGVNIALGSQPVSTCAAFANADGAVDIAQLIAGVNNALSGCADHRFRDNSDGTITDTKTRLMWEKKVGIGAGVDGADLHTADNSYAWAGLCLNTFDLCQPNDAAAVACGRWTQGEQIGCNTCDSDQACVVFYGVTTIWDWVAQLNAATFASYADWRVPTVAELESILDYTAHDPSVDRVFNGADCGATCTDLTSQGCSCTQIYSPDYGFCGPYWAASTSIPFLDGGWWFVEFCRAGVHFGDDAGRFPSDLYARAVRGGSEVPASRFLDNADGTVTDDQTNLIWEKKIAAGAGAGVGNLHEADNTYTWAGECSAATGVSCQPNEAAAATCMQGAHGDQTGCATCQAEQGTCTVDPWGRGAATTIWDWVAQLNAANFAGHTDWRVPTEAVLLSIVDYTSADPALDSAFGEAACTAGFSGSCGWYWSANSVPYAPGLAWFVTFDWGEVYSNYESYDLHVRAVRGRS